ncbi:MAG: hypothetical protein UX57_C0024G0006 [Candidatus Uhrbacteria bacterium GW2011_GWE2_46_68]|uniref:Uncharacterized protein n=1 Tax=Candidatus Uhrbacteria bacterium GW2011_GWE2_46_68 TaxID=1618994 RepID=A0A0G1Q5D5_9BACT|nr:MAG: hypothetical protein UX57_C0024G0006 [Candidatus Uhrbacteria bacterium GW2011_GWE2_46_68]
MWPWHEENKTSLLTRERRFMAERESELIFFR